MGACPMSGWMFLRWLRGCETDALRATGIACGTSSGGLDDLVCAPDPAEPRWCTSGRWSPPEMRILNLTQRADRHQCCCRHCCRQRPAHGTDRGDARHRTRSNCQLTFLG